MRDDTQLLNNGLDSELDSYDTAEDIKRTDYIYMVSGNNLVISLNAELDHHLADEMREVIDDIIDKRGVDRVIIDFSKVDFMDSAGIGLIMGRYKKIRDIGDICVVGINESIKRILLISGLHKIVDIYDNLCDAVRKQNKRGCKMQENNVDVIFDAISENESFARVVAAAFVTRLDPTLEEISDIKTAVSEAVTNSIVHGYEGKGGKVYMTLSLEDREIIIRIKDEGVGIENVHKAMEPLYTTKPELERSGMGFSFMEAFMDELNVYSRKNVGTTVIMKKRIGESNR